MDFDKKLDRTGTSCLKWDYIRTFYEDNEIVPMWVADSDFEVPVEVKEALIRRAQHGAFGYTVRPKAFYDAIINWLDKKYSWKIKKDWLVYTPGIVAAINWAIKTYSEKGAKVIVQSPVYYPFFSAVTGNERTLIDNQLVLKDGKYRMDFDRLETQIDKDTKMIILCSPHNPVTRVWTKDELQRLGEICVKNDILIISDEIHSDLILEGNAHTPTSMISPDIQNNTITLMAPSKTFNVAGLETSVAIIPNPELKEEFVNFQKSIGAGMSNIFGIEAFIACYEHGEKWLEEQLKYIKGNVEFVKDYIKQNMDQIEVIDPEGTYLLWVDCRCLELSNDELKDFFIKKVKVVLDLGTIFGQESGKDYVRFNLATQRGIIKKVLDSFKNQYDARMKELANKAY
ncbi:MAG: pyridoxal phosphate-dependent aminotransferase [Proteobacteria bacterium]|nr:pyridoxal phosphate-dependent aminotransferase [Pseudomonadota bacterium]